MVYRRKVILALLQGADGALEKISLQKLLFFLTSRQTEPSYDFIPYQFGCYSISADADLVAMAAAGLVEEQDNRYTKKDKANYLSKLEPTDKKLVTEVLATYGKYSSKTLMKMVYLNYQYYAIKSNAAKELLNDEQYKKVEAAVPTNNETALFTIGYEGVSLEKYLNKLIQNNVKVLVDVRNNPLSMKFGFSKNQLKRYCESVDIEYLHVPDLGIQSEYRQELKTQEDYDALFKTYRTNNLNKTTDSQHKVLSLLWDKKRIALTCFEENIHQCHRLPLAEALVKLSERPVRMQHI